ncbi:MAG: hypothetical protein AB1393_10980 [Candidatus Edwardsbacteria bacterium]
MKNKGIVSKLTQVYLNYGIIPIAKEYRNAFPIEKKSIKIEAVFDDNDVVYPLTFDPQQNRFFGVKGWYKTLNAKPGDFITIEPLTPQKRYRFRLKPQKYELSTERALQQIKISKKKGREISTVGEPINYGGLIYAPVNELGVVLLFGMVFEELGMIVEEVRSTFPDATIRRFNGRGWSREFVEFEYRSSQYKQHKHPLEDCDIIVCWLHDWNDCPHRFEVCELKSLIKLLPRGTIEKHLKKNI